MDRQVTARRAGMSGLKFGVAAARAMLLCGTWALVGGCATLSSILNPEFTSALGLGDSVATIPGEAPEILVTSQNDTGRTIQMTVSYRDAEGEVRTLANIIEAGQKTATALPCPVTEITLGDISNLDDPGAFVLLGNGTLEDPFVEVEPFGVLLREDSNYNCGDALTFSVQLSSATRSGYQTFFYVQRGGATQP